MIMQSHLHHFPSLCLYTQKPVINGSGVFFYDYSSQFKVFISVAQASVHS